MKEVRKKNHLKKISKGKLWHSEVCSYCKYTMKRMIHNNVHTNTNSSILHSKQCKLKGTRNEW